MANKPIHIIDLGSRQGEGTCLTLIRVAATGIAAHSANTDRLLTLLRTQ